MRAIGIDTSLRSTGLAVVEFVGNRLSPVEFGVVRVPAGTRLTEGLRRLHDGIAAFIERTRPEESAVEGVFFSKNVRTSLLLGEARGVAILTCAARGLPVFEYSPRRVKQALVGFGGAEKEQVRRMVVSLLGLAEEPQEDAGDALAIAVCHLHNSARHAVLKPEPI